MTHAAVNIDGPNIPFPVPNTQYVSESEVTYGGTVPIEMVALSLRSIDPVELNLDERQIDDRFTVDSFFDVWFEVSLNDGEPVQQVLPNTPVQFALTRRNTGFFDTEMVSMSLSANIGGTDFIIREDPELTSIGTLTVTDLGGDQFRVDSFFDVFTELSTDSGSNWDNSIGALRVTIIPEPSALGGLFGLAALLIARRRQD